MAASSSTTDSSGGGRVSSQAWANFLWRHGPPGATVTVHGSWDGWADGVPASWSFVECAAAALVLLDPGTHQYKFRVNGSWCYDVESPSVDDGVGGRNNVFTVIPLWLPKPVPGGPPPVNVMTYNIRYASARDGINRWDARKEHLCDVIQACARTHTPALPVPDAARVCMRLHPCP